MSGSTREPVPPRRLLEGTRRALRITCPRCDQAPGQRCRNPKGSPVDSVVHSERRQAAAAAKEPRS
jgi:hypothetical protein